MTVPRHIFHQPASFDSQRETLGHPVKKNEKTSKIKINEMEMLILLTKSQSVVCSVIFGVFRSPLLTIRAAYEPDPPDPPPS